MLVALFNSNQAAFDGNMNRLRAGSILTIPSAEEAAATPAAEATKTVRIQAADWRGYQDKVAGAAPPSEGAGARVAGGKIGTTVEEKVPAAVPGRDQLKVSPQPGKGAPGTTAAEEVVSRDKALKEAQTRINDLEKTLKDLQKALELKGQSGAQVAAAPQGKAPEPAKAEPPKAEAPKAPAAPAAAPAPAPAAPDMKAPEPPKAAMPAPVEPPKAAPPAKAPVPKAEGAKAPTKESSMIDDIVGSTPGWVIGGGAFAALAGVAALIAARRRRTVKFEDSIIGGTDIKTNTVFGSTGGGVVNTGENSLATDFSREGLGSIDTDEVDPIAEAEVYLAYGRDAQAEEILKDALKKDPNRQEIYLKLLEIHAQHNKPSAFETVAAELYSVSQGKGESWQKAVTLGRQLDPNNPMFGEGGGAAAAAAAATGAGIVGIAAASAAVPDKGQGRRRAEAVVLRLRSRKSSRTTARSISASTKTSRSRARATPPRPRSRRSTPPNTSSRNPRSIWKADRSWPRKTRSARPSAWARRRRSPPLRRLRLTSISASIPTPAGLADGAAAKTTKDDSVSPALARPQAAIDLDKLDLAFGPDQHATFEDPTPSVLDGQWHDAATKLDLAKAYQEMGDVEGAREILQEVLHEGDDTQKAEAQVLLAKLG